MEYNPFVGGYCGKHNHENKPDEVKNTYNLVKASNRRYLEELKNRGHEMKDLYDSKILCRKLNGL